MKRKNLYTLLFFVISFSFLQAYSMQQNNVQLKQNCFYPEKPLLLGCKTCSTLFGKKSLFVEKNNTNNNTKNSNQQTKHNTKNDLENDLPKGLYRIKRLIESETKEFFICKKCNFLAKNKEQALAHLNNKECKKNTGRMSDLFVQKNYVKKENSIFACNLCDHKMDKPDSRHFSNKHLIKVGIHNDRFFSKDLLEGQALEKKDHIQWSQLMIKKGFTKKIENFFWCLYPNCKYKHKHPSRMVEHILLFHEANPNKNLSEQINDRKITTKGKRKKDNSLNVATKKRNREEMEWPEKEENIDPVLKNSECFYSPDPFCQEHCLQNSNPYGFYQDDNQDDSLNNFHSEKNSLSTMPDVQDDNDSSLDICSSCKVYRDAQNFAQDQDPEYDFTQGFKQNFAQDPEQDFEHDFDKRPEFGNQNTNPDNFDPFANEPEKESLSDGFCEPYVFDKFDESLLND